MLYRFKEQVSTALAAQKEGFTGSEWDVVLVEAGWSLNRGESGFPRYYPADALKKRVSLFEGLSANIFLFGDKLDHLPDEALRRLPEGYAANKIGYYHDVRFGNFTRPDGTKGEGIIGRLHILEGAKWLRENMLDAWTNGQTKLYQFSIDADGESQIGSVEGRPAEIITNIISALSTDVVSKAAAGGGVLRVAASAQGEATVDKLLSLLKAHRARWLEGYTGPTNGQSQSDYVMGIFQGNLAKAKDVLASAALKEGVATADLARGVQSIGHIITMLREGKVEEAEAALEGWLPKHAALTEGEKDVLAISDYSLPGEKAAPAAPAPAAPAPAAAAPAGDPARVAESVNDKTAARLDRLERREKRIEVVEKLKESGLPDRAQKMVLDQVEGHLLADDLTTRVAEAITSQREYLTSLRETGQVVGLGHGHGGGGSVQITADEHQKHCDAMLGFFNNDNKRVNGVKPFTSLHESYITVMRPRQHLSRKQLADRIMFCMGRAVAGRPEDDCEDHVQALRESWSSHVGRRILESIATPDWTVAFGDAMFKRLQRETTDANRNDWQDLVSSRESNQDINNPVKIFRTGGIKPMPIVAEKAAYQELDPVTPTEESTDLILNKHGGLVKVSWEAMLADSARAVRQIPVKLGRASAKTIQKAAFDPIELNETTQDAVSLFNSEHNNLVATALSYATIVTGVLQLRNQTELDSGDKLGLEPEFLWVPNELEATAVEILESLVKVTTNEDGTVRSFINRLGIQVRKSVSLGRTSATEVFAYLTARRGDSEGIAIGFLNGKETPDVFVQGPNETPTSGEAFTSDTLTFKSRMPVEAVAVDHRFAQRIGA